MNYKSNLEVPDLRPYFKLKDPPITIMGHDIPSDPDYDPNCGYWSQDECAILCAVASQVRGDWLDIGCRLGWTAKHINWMTNGPVLCVDPDLYLWDFRMRFQQNVGNWPANWLWSRTSSQFFEGLADQTFSGFVIDGNHDSPEPLNDAMNAAKFAAPGCVIMLHDYWGGPIRDAADWLLSQGWTRKVYFTPNGVACLWRGLPDFVAPEHVRDPAIDWRGIERMLAE